MAQMQNQEAQNLYLRLLNLPVGHYAQQDPQQKGH